ncbi:MAG: tetratricopeptide repeat protein [Gemmataceae bacterium]|nr:tetratricopeptide repeat protein [Gemmataceae bacterium]MCI0738485.1 tetratricopeptide repeat protein [Gemmataceae bacterium]
MRSWLLRIYRFIKRPWVAVSLLLLAAACVVGTPQVRAWYHLSAGRTALESFHSGKALDHLNRCLGTWPSSVEARLLAARAARRVGLLEVAARHVDECRKRAGAEQSGQIALEWALLRATIGDLTPVEEHLQARAQKYPAEAPLIWEALAEGYRRMCRIHEALMCLDHWLALESNNAQAVYMRGVIYRQIGAVNRAAQDYSLAVEIDPERNDVRWLLAQALVQLARYQEALEQLEILRPKAPDLPDLLVYTARCNFHLGHKEKANELLEAVLEAHPDHGLALMDRGRQLLAENKPREAEPWLKKSVQALPYHYEATFALSQSLLQQGKTDEGNAQLTHARRLNDRLERLIEIEAKEMPRRPFDPALHCELGILLIGLGQKESGYTWLKNALQLEPHNPAAHSALADYYQHKGDTTQADFHRQEAEKTPPPQRAEKR